MTSIWTSPVCARWISSTRLASPSPYKRAQDGSALQTRASVLRLAHLTSMARGRCRIDASNHNQSRGCSAQQVARANGGPSQSVPRFRPCRGRFDAWGLMHGGRRGRSRTGESQARTVLMHADHWHRGAYGLDYWLPVARLCRADGEPPEPASQTALICTMLTGDGVVGPG